MGDLTIQLHLSEWSVSWQLPPARWVVALTSGVPVDMDGTGRLIRGLVMITFWSPVATNGTWADNADSGASIGASDTYESAQPIRGLRWKVVR